MRVVGLTLAGLVALTGVAVLPDDRSGQLGILIGPTVDGASGMAQVLGLGLPVLDIRLGGRLVIIAADSDTTGRIALADLRGRLPAGMIVLNARGETCVTVQARGGSNA